MGKVAAVSMLLALALAIPCLAQHEPTIISERQPGENPVEGIHWMALRTPRDYMNGLSESLLFDTGHQGIYQGIFETQAGNTVNYSLVIYSDDDLTPPPHGTCTTLPRPPLVEGTNYFVARDPEVGALYIEQIEEGEIWLFRLHNRVFFKKTPFTYGAEPVTVMVELYDPENRLVSSMEFSVEQWGLAEARTDNDSGPQTRILFIGSAADEEEFGGSFEYLTPGQWLHIPLDNGLGMVKVWSKNEVSSCNVYVDGVENISEPVEPERLGLPVNGPVPVS